MNKRIDRLEHEFRGAPRIVENKEAVLLNLNFGVNKHLTDREEIKSKLADFGILSCSSFGGSDPPEDKTVAISQYLSKETLKEVITLAEELGFKFYSIFDNRAENISEDVLIGAYSVDRYEILSKSA